MPALLFLLLIWLLPLHARASTPPSSAPAGEQARKKEEKKSEEEKDAEMDAAEAEEERKRKEKLSRVIVLKWPNTSADYTDETIQRNVRSRIARPDAMFFPEVDLYQNGRKLKDQTVIPAMQPALVPDTNVPVVLRAVNEISGVPWDALAPDQWGLKAQELRALAEDLWFVDRVELREPIFLLYTQIGRAAENQNFPAPPFYQDVGNITVNYYWYLAALLAYQEPALMSKLTDQELSGGISYLLQQIQSGSFPTLKLDFSMESVMEADFGESYEVLLNGLPIELNGRGQFDVFLGRNDIYLKRKDTGHGMSERLEVLKLEENVYFVRDSARKLMGNEFIDQLFLNPNECTPELDGNILNFLAIYAKLHSKSDIYIAVPEFGKPNKVWIWRYDRTTAQLSLVAGGDEFPVHFAFLFSSGLMYNGAVADVEEPTPEEVAGEGGEASQGGGPDSSDIPLSIEPTPGLVPFNFEFRIHYNRLMVNMGAEYGLPLTDEDADGTRIAERYPMRGNYPEAEDGIQAGEYIATTQRRCTTVQNEDGEDEVVCAEVYNKRVVNRDLYLGLGLVLGRDAGIGFGPRFAARFGWLNIPHAFQTTGHFGWSIQPPIGKATGRVRPLVDADLRAGAIIPRKDSLRYDLVERDKDQNLIVPIFGLTLGIGLTF